MSPRLRLLLLFVLISLAATSAKAQCNTDTSCQYLSCRSPAVGQPSSLWGELEPVDLGQLPADRDNTQMTDLQVPSPTRPRWMAIDTEGSWAFVGITHGIQIWSTTNPATPVKMATVGNSSFLSWAPDPHEGNPLRDVAVPPGNSNIAAAGVAGGGGLNVFNTTSKSSPSARYADGGKTVLQVHAARINNVDYAFAASTDNGVTAYSLTQAAALVNACVDISPATTSCGPYRGRVGTRTTARYVSGVGNAAQTQHWIAFSSGNNFNGLELWEVTNPASPVQKLVVSAGAVDFIYGSAMWRDGSNYYLALRRRISNTVTQGQIYNVNCLAAGSCSSLGSPIAVLNLPNETDEYFITHSTVGSRQFLYFGNNNRCATTQQNEWLYDVTNPAVPDDITPPDGLVGGLPSGYWGWGYRRNPSGFGFNEVMPRRGLFVGAYFYRMGYSIFDIHRLVTSAPTAAFTYSPSTVYRGQPVNFGDQSTGAPTNWSWTFSGGSPGSSTAQNPSGVVFSTTGNKSVTLVASNNNGASTPAAQNITVLEPAAQVASVSATPNPALICQGVTFQAVGVTGLGTITHAWQVRDSGNVLVASGGNVNPFVWDTSAASPGTYTATVTVSNTSGSDTATSPVVTVNALPNLAFTGPGNAPETLNGPPFGSAQVAFRIQAAGATEWRWDFGDGSTPVWTTSPTTGPQPTHEYQDQGDYTVSVEIRNCQQAAITSNSLVVTIPDLTPLVANFVTTGLFCTATACFADLGEPVTFLDSTVGGPDFWDYSWDGDVNFEDPDHTAPVTSHTYNLDGTFFPQLRVRRGATVDTYQFSVPIFVGNGGLPTVTLSSPGEGEVYQPIVFNASAPNCDPQPSSWSWDTGSSLWGAIDGSASGSSVSITYSMIGSFTVTATALDGGCVNLSDSETITLTAGAAGLFDDGFESGDLTGWTTVVP